MGRLAVHGTDGAVDEVVASLGELRGLASKVGQMASYVEGMAPADGPARDALARLRDATWTSSPAAIRACVEAELGRPLHELFPTWDDTPLASASLGQVHRASLPDGTQVAVKVQHPGIEDAVRSDLAQVAAVGSVARHLVRGVPVDALLHQVRAQLLDELDYRQEAENQRVYHAAFAGHPLVGIPRVFDAWSTQRVLTTELVSGVPVEVAALRADSVRRAAATATWTLFMEGALRTRRLHGDPHPGNLMFREDGLWALDFGNVVHLDGEAVATWRALLTAGLAGRDPAVTLRDHLGDAPFVAAMTPLWTALLAPLREPSARITRADAAALTPLIQDAKRPGVALRRGGPVPPWFVLALRTVIGLWSILGRLDVDVPYAALTEGALGRTAGG